MVEETGYGYTTALNIIKFLLKLGIITGIL